MRAALLLTALSAIVALGEACKDGITPDCTTDPTVCSPIYGGDDDDAEASTPDASDAGDASDDASSDAADDAADSSG